MIFIISWQSVGVVFLLGKNLVVCLEAEINDDHLEKKSTPPPQKPGSAIGAWNIKAFFHHRFFTLKPKEIVKPMVELNYSCSFHLNISWECVANDPHFQLFFEGWFVLEMSWRFFFSYFSWPYKGFLIVLCSPHLNWFIADIPAAATFNLRNVTLAPHPVTKSATFVKKTKITLSKKTDVNILDTASTLMTEAWATEWTVWVWTV